MLRRSAFVALIAIASFGAQRVHADESTSVLVLGLRAVDGDDELANSITSSLRAEAMAVPGWAVNPREVSLAQMALAHGCDETATSCVKEMARSLEVDQLIYGNVRRSSEGEAASTVIVSLYLYDLPNERIARSAADTIPATLEGNELVARARRYISELSGRSQQGSLHVHTAPHASVRVDRKEKGKSDDEGNIVIEALEAGTHHVHVSLTGFVPEDATVDITAGTETTTELTLQPRLTSALAQAADDTEENQPHQQGSKPNLHKILGWTAIGVGSASLITTVVGWSRLSALGHSSPLDAFGEDKTFRRYREAVGAAHGSSADACSEARGDPSAGRGGNAYDLGEGARKHVVKVCREGDFWETAQWVFLAVGIASTAAGTYLLLTDPSTKRKQRHSRGPTINGSVDARGARFSATFSF